MKHGCGKSVHLIGTNDGTITCGAILYGRGERAKPFLCDACRKTVSISGLWLRTTGDRIQVLVERAGVWYLVIDKYGPLNEMSISHIVEPSGIEQASEDTLI